MAVGKRVRPDGWDDRTAGLARYTTDITLPEMLVGGALRSPHPHARIRAIDVSAARRLAGVAAVITAKDLPDTGYIHLGGPFSDRSVLARDRVRFVGEEVAAVAAESPQILAKALALIEVEYQLLDPSLTPAKARSAKAVAIHDAAQDNVALEADRAYGDIAAARSQADVVINGSYRYPAATHLCMELHAAVASWDDQEERMDLWVSTQAPYFVRKEVAHVLGLDMDQVHTHEVAVGGGFGAKAKAGLHEAIAAALSMQAGRPVRLVLDRVEEFSTTAARHPLDADLTTGARADGTLTHREGSLVIDNGAYNHAGPSVAIFTTMLAASLYRLDACETSAALVYTNKQPGASFRGYGNPQVTFAMESQLDELAEALGIDRVELRIKNAHVRGDETLTGWKLESARLVECLERARDEIGWAAKQALAGSGRGVGLAAAIHVSGANAFEHSEFSGAALDVRADGSVEIRFAGADAGTGQSTLLRQIAAEELGVAFDDTSVTMMESDGTPIDLGAWSSRGTVWGGHAVADTAGKAAAILRTIAAEKLGVRAQDVELADGQARCGADAVDIGDLVMLSDDLTDGRLAVEGGYLTDVDKMDKVTGLGNFSPAYSFAVQAVEVDVDFDTGNVTVVGVVSVHDSGAALNPAAAEGQVTGAVAMGLGAALGEELLYQDGRLTNPSFLEYPALRSGDTPTIRAILLDGHDPKGPYGAKGLGEIGLVPTPAAVANAVAHATGVRVRDLPITPDKLLPHLRPPASRTSTAKRPSRWWIAAMRALYAKGLYGVLHRWGTRWAQTEQVTQTEELTRPTELTDALAQHSDESAYVAGGTDLLVARDQHLVAPVRLIDLTTVRSMGRIDDMVDAGLRIGATVTLAELAAHTATSGDTVLSEVLAALATPQIREMATVGGNLLQEKRCSFYRNGFSCYKRGGWTCPCYAINGDHRFHHAVIGAHRCQAVTPSDLATGLVALDAAVAISGPNGDRELGIDTLYVGPGESALADGEILTSVTVPIAARERCSVFEKLQLYAGDFAVCSAGVSVELVEMTISDVRIGLGGVAPTPYRAIPTETQLVGLDIQDADRIEAAAGAWARDAHPLANNAWKVDAASGLIRRALGRIASEATMGEQELDPQS